MNKLEVLNKHQIRPSRYFGKVLMTVVVIVTLMFNTEALIGQTSSRSSTTQIDKNTSQITARVNSTRAKGCKCGGKYYSAVGPVTWNQKLKQSSQKYAAQMHKYKRFDHNGIDGSVVGDRVDAEDYFWQLAGENIGEGYHTFEEVYRAWLASPSHCKLIMNGRMKDLAVSRQGKYWVLHMGLLMPAGTDRTNIRYH